jgi:2-polyprenyl-3-methyl-5-hydroxy-6-metoxy-1,4-benzoquinol methylase
VARPARARRSRRAAAPNAHLTAEVGDLRPGRALDAGCGHGSDTVWLAARGWQVTAVDFVATVLAHARSTAEAMGPDVAERVDWVEADLATGTRSGMAYDLVVCLYVRVAGSVEAALAVLDRDRWELVAAEDRPRPVAGTASTP